MNEDKLEQLCLEWFRDNGWDVVYGLDIAQYYGNPDRSDLDGQRFQTFYNA